MKNKDLLEEQRLAELLEQEAGTIETNLDLWPLIEQQLKAAQTTIELAPDGPFQPVEPVPIKAQPKPLLTLPRLTKVLLGMAAVLALAIIIVPVLLTANNGPLITPASFSPGANATVPPATPHPVTATLQATLTGHTAAVRALAWKPDGSQLASGSEDNTIKVWDSTGKLQNTFGYPTPVYSLGWRPDNGSLKPSPGEATDVLAPGGNLKAVRSKSDMGEVQIQQTDGTVEATLSVPKGAIGQIAWSPDGKTIAASGQTILRAGPGDIRVWLWRADGSLIATLKDFFYLVNSIAWSPSGKTLAIAAKGENQAGLWSAEGKPLVKFEGKFVIWSLAWSPDGRTLAAGCSDNMVRLWSSEGALEATLAGHQDEVWTVAWSPDGKTLASGSGDKTIKLWAVK
jgi:WD40 repeat protein